MKKLGLVGGMGPESTLPYYRQIVYGVQERLGEKRFPPLSIESVDVFQVLGLCSRQAYGELKDYLLQAVQNLAAAGAQFGALTANTPHIVFDQLQAESPIPLVSIVEAAALAAQERKYCRLGLLGTAFTMENDFFRRPFDARGIKLVTPQARERQLIAKRIEDELEIGVVKEETRGEFQQIIRRMKQEEGIEGVILGCTELPLLLNDEVSPVPCLDTMEIHVRTLVDMILEQPQV